MKLVLLSFLLIFVSCKKHANKSDLKDNIYFELIKYQKENPLTKDVIGFLSVQNFIYEVVILPPNYVNENDTNISVFITCSTFGIKNNNEHIYGVYESSELKKTYIIDEADKIKDFVKIPKKKDLDKYIITNSPIIDIIFPKKLYNFTDGKLLLTAELPGNIKRN